MTFRLERDTVLKSVSTTSYSSYAMASAPVHVSGKFLGQSLPSHHEPENVLRAQFMKEFVKPSETSRTITTLQLPATVDHAAFISYLKDRVLYYQRAYEKEKISKRPRTFLSDNKLKFNIFIGRGPTIIVVTRTEQEVELFETLFRADTADNSIYTRIIFSYEKTNKFGNRQKAVELFIQRCRGIFICAENCLSGIINFFIFD